MTLTEAFKAGARIARTGGEDALATCERWCEENKLSLRRRIAVLKGFHAEIENNPLHKPGKRLGGR